MDHEKIGDDRSRLTDDPTNSRQLDPGQLIEGRYKVLSLIGRGAVGSVYEVEQVFLRKRYALKVLDPIVTSDTNIRRFQQEAQAANKMDHPNLAKAVDCGVVDGKQPFLVMELVDGQTLQEYLKCNGKLSVDLALELFIQLCFGLGYAHGEGVIHRDIKPSNIILMPIENGKFLPKIVDFGIAKVSLISEEEAKGLTKTGEVFGTPLYMSPEQCSGIKVDGRSDIYSLGCVLFEALTQTPPIVGNTALETIMRHQTGTAPTLKEASLGEDFPPPLETIVAKMLAKQPNDRYISALDAARDLSNVQRKQTNLVQTPPVPVASQETLSKKILVRAAVFLTCTFVGLALINHISGTKEEPKPKSSQENNTNKVPDKTLEDNGFPEDSTKTLEKGELPYSSVLGTNRIFTFPGEESLGSLTWRNGNEDLTRVARRSVVIPQSASVILRPNFTIYRKPSYLSRFRSDDLTGIVFFEPTVLATSDQHSDRPLRFLPLLKSLRMVSLTNNPASDESIESIGMLPNLHWLILNDSFSHGDKLAKMNNLAELRVLAAHNIDKATRLLSQLVKANKLTMLSLQVENLTDRDFELISQLHQLHTLSLLCDLPKHALAPLVTMPKLTRLCLHGSAIDANAIAILRRMKALEHLSVVDVSDHQIELLSTLDQVKELYIPEPAINAHTAQVLKSMNHLRVLHIRAASAEAIKTDRPSNLVRSTPTCRKVLDYIPEGRTQVFDWFELYLDHPGDRADPAL